MKEIKLVGPSKLNLNCYSDLGKRLGINEVQISRIAGDINNHYYSRQELIGKKTNYFSVPFLITPKKERTIYHTSEELATIQKQIDKMLRTIEIPETFIGGMTGKSIRTNAEIHSGSRYMANFDIKDFYPSITNKVVRQLFLNLGCTEPLSKLLTRLTTADNKLPQGFNSSPIIGVLVLLQIEKDLGKLFQGDRVNYTFWVDDLTISSNSTLKRYEKSIDKIFLKNGYELHSDSKKRSFLGPLDRKVCTGIVVSKSANIAKSRRREIRNVLYVSSKYGIESYLAANNIPLSKDKFLEILGGRIAFMNYINPKNKVFLEKFRELKAKECHAI